VNFFGLVDLTRQLIPFVREHRGKTEIDLKGIRSLLQFPAAVSQGLYQHIPKGFHSQNEINEGPILSLFHLHNPRWAD
jgi:hypothetical protein